MLALLANVAVFDPYLPSQSPPEHVNLLIASNHVSFHVQGVEVDRQAGVDLRKEKYKLRLVPLGPRSRFPLGGGPLLRARPSSACPAYAYRARADPS